MVFCVEKYLYNMGENARNLKEMKTFKQKQLAYIQFFESRTVLTEPNKILLEQMKDSFKRICQREKVFIGINQILYN